MTTNPSSPQDEPKIPTEGEIATLPRWACVAFAARCARRVQPLFTHFWPDAPREHVEAIDKAITLAERRFEGSRSASVNTADADADAYAYADAAARAARAAADAAAYAYAYAYAAAAAARAADAAAAAARAAAAASAADIRSLIRQDFDQLQSRAKSERWTDDTPVPPEVFGPMWPDGVPEGWPGRKAPDDRSWIVGPLASLPHLARVAVAVRATRRVQSLLDLDMSSKHEELQRGIEEVLSAVERAFTTGRTSEIGSRLLKNLGFDSEQGPTTPMAGAVLTEVLFATQHTLTALLSPSDPATGSATDTQAVLDAIEWSEHAMQSAKLDSASQTSFFDAIANDLRVLVERSKKNNWSDSDSVDLVSLGALWPDGVPDGWPRSTKSRRSGRKQERGRPKLVIKFTIPPMEDTPENRASFREHVKSVLLAANELHIARGGGGLKIRDVKTWLPQPAPVEAGGGQ